MIFVYTLGAALIDAGDMRVTPASNRKFAMLLHLSAEPGRRVSRTALQDLVFPDQTEKNAKHSLRELVYQFRQAGVRIASDPHGIELVPGEVGSDYAAMIERERLDADQIAAAAAGFLPGYAPEHSEAFTEWFDAYRSRVVLELSKKLLLEVVRARSAGEWAITERAARACLVLDPLNEDATLALAEMLAIGGAKVQAVKLLDDYMLELGPKARDIRLPASVLKRRIGEKMPDHYRPKGDLPYIGREDEMRRLRQMFDAARIGESICVVLAGEPGIGKTRLAAEFSVLAAVEGAHVLRVALQPADVRRPMSVFLELVPMLLELPGALGCSPGSMAALARITGRQLSGETSLEDREPEFISYAIATSIADLFDAIGSESAVVVVVEDAHWLDEHSTRAILELIASTRPRRLMIIATTRDGSQLQQFGRHVDRLAAIPIERLRSAASRELLAAAMGSAPGESDVMLRNWIADTANGNPLFLVSLVAHYRTTQKKFEVPAGLRDLLGARLGSLSRRATIALQTCVALGRRCSVDRLRTCLDMAHIDLLTCIAELDAAYVILFEQDQVLPSHPLLAEVLLDRSSDVTRKLTHFRVAEILQAEASTTHDSLLAWDCAEHWAIAGEDERALTAFRVCAEQAKAIGRTRAAAEILLRAASLNISTDTRLQTLRDTMYMAASGGEYDLVVEAANLARPLTIDSIHDDLELAELRASVAMLDDSNDVQLRLVKCTTDPGTSAEHRAQAALMLTKYSDAYWCPDEAAIAAHAMGTLDMGAVSRTVALEYTMVYHIAFGDEDTAVEAARSLRDHSASLAPAAAASALINTAILFWRAGRPAECVEAYIDAYMTAERSGSFRLTSIAALRLAGLYYDLGDFESANTWHARDEALSAKYPDHSDRIESTILAISIALSQANASLAAALIAEGESRGAFGSAHRQRWLRVFKLRLSHLTRRVPLPEFQIRALVGDGCLKLISGVEDEEISAASLELLAQNRRDEAQRILADYVNTRRRCKAPLGWALQLAMKRCEFAYSIPLADYGYADR
ncbi:MAG: hypothetical protein JWM41_1143 [Gemmatimonadetes bacterium]|nr:hypothetical protein [Gemmatimonadota bacterium]